MERNAIVSAGEYIWEWRTMWDHGRGDSAAALSTRQPPLSFPISKLAIHPMRLAVRLKRTRPMILICCCLLIVGFRPKEESLPGEPLTAREIEVLGMMAEGLGNKTIAARLNISEHTVKFDVSSILAKLGAASRTEAVTRGVREGLIMI